MFEIYDYKTKTTSQLDSISLKEYIISKTMSTFENKSVTSERTGTRPTLIAPHLVSLKNGILLKDIFLVTAVNRINDNIDTRYLLVATGSKNDYIDFIPKINNSIPFIHIDCSSFTPSHQGGYLSSWFRENMGRAFSFIDIDFIFLKKDKIILIEEKTFLGTMGYGQTLSYNELLSDIFSTLTTMCLLKVSGDQVTFQTKLKDQSFVAPRTESIESFISLLDR